MSARRSWLAAGGLLSLLLVTAALFATPTAAEVEGEVHYRLESPEEADIHARVNLTGEHAQALRERVDHDDDGRVSALEAAGARGIADDRIQGTTDAYTLDGAPYENEQAVVSSEGLRGPTDSEDPVTLEVEIDATTEAGASPHVFAVHGPPANLTQNASAAGDLVAHVYAPEGYVIADADGFATADACHARSQPGVEEASLELAREEEACQRPAPAAGAWVGLSLLAAALLARARRARR